MIPNPELILVLMTNLLAPVLYRSIRTALLSTRMLALIYIRENRQVKVIRQLVVYRLAITQYIIDN